MRMRLLSSALFVAFGCFAFAEVSVDVTQGEDASLSHAISTLDLLQGQLPIEVDPAPPYGLDNPSPWHPANADPNDQWPSFTDGLGRHGLSGLFRDYASEFWDAKYCAKTTYDLGSTINLGEVRVFSQNWDADSRVFHTYLLEVSPTLTGDNFTILKYVQSHPSGTQNSSTINNWHNAESTVLSPTGVIASGVRRIRLTFWSTGDVNGVGIRDPFLGVNPYTGIDDGLYEDNVTPYVSPLIQEIDAFPAKVPQVSGKVVLGDFGGSVVNSVVRLELKQGGVVKEQHYLKLASDGSYGFNTQLTGTYDAVVRSRHFLSDKKTVTLGAPQVVGFTLDNGDIDGDNGITVFDYNYLSAAFDMTAESAGWNVADSYGIAPKDSDLDGDGSVTVFDYNILSGNFDKFGLE